MKCASLASLDPAVLVRNVAVLFPLILSRLVSLRLGFSDLPASSRVGLSVNIDGESETVLHQLIGKSSTDPSPEGAEAFRDRVQWTAQPKAAHWEGAEICDVSSTSSKP